MKTSIDIDWSKAPEGATHYLPKVDLLDYDTCWYRLGGNGLWRACNAGNYAETGKEPWSIDTDEVGIFTKYLVKRPSSPAWNGEGMPPVGTVCEYRDSFADWHKVEITGHAKLGVCFVVDGRSGECYVKKETKFRPIRTTEQIAADELEAAIDEVMDDLSLSPECRYIALRVVQAGYSKQGQPT